MLTVDTGNGTHGCGIGRSAGSLMNRVRLTPSAEPRRGCRYGLSQCHHYHVFVVYELGRVSIASSSTHGDCFVIMVVLSLFDD